jgi:translation initiation factor 3 subunit D
VINCRARIGKIGEYDVKYDRIGTRQPMALKVDEKIGIYNWVSTIENSFVDIIKENKDLNVFASDAVVATLMTVQSSVYPWDISVEKRQGKIILDCCESRIITYTTINENATVAPDEKDSGINGMQKLSWEATMSNHYFGQQALLPDSDYVLGEEPRFKLPPNKTKPRKGYIYKAWDMGNGVKLCVRCQVDAYIKEEKGSEAVEEKKTEEEIKFVNLRAVNEFYEAKRQMTWKQALENNRSLVTSEISINDSTKLTKWSIEALLGGVENIRMAYLTRRKINDNKKHDIIEIARYTTRELKNLINLNYESCWGILNMIIQTLHEQEDGSYHLVKDPNKLIIRLYKKIKLSPEELE